MVKTTTEEHKAVKWLDQGSVPKPQSPNKFENLTAQACAGVQNKS